MPKIKAKQLCNVHAVIIWQHLDRNQIIKITFGENTVFDVRECHSYFVCQKSTNHNWMYRIQTPKPWTHSNRSPDFHFMSKECKKESDSLFIRWMSVYRNYSLKHTRHRLCRRLLFYLPFFAFVFPANLIPYGLFAPFVHFFFVAWFFPFDILDLDFVPTNTFAFRRKTEQCGKKTIEIYVHNLW